MAAGSVGLSVCRLPHTELRGHCSHLGCQHHCVPTLNGPTCYCNNTFQLQADGKTCKGMWVQALCAGAGRGAGQQAWLSWENKMEGAREEVWPHARQLQGATGALSTCFHQTFKNSS